MKLGKKRKDILFYLGLLLLFFWLADSFDKIFIAHKAFRMLWYSSASLALTTIALLFKNDFLIVTAAGATMIIEGVWILGFFSILLFGRHLTGIAEYMFAPHFPKLEFAITMYHMLIVPFAILAVHRVRKISKFGWLGASSFALAVGFLTYLLVPKTENVNCVYAIDHCQSFFWYLYTISNPARIFVAVFFLTFGIYIPTNYLVTFFRKK